MKHYSLYLSIVLTGAPAYILAMELPITRKQAVTRNYSLVTNCNHDQEKGNEEAQQAVENELVYSKKVIAALSQKLAKYEAEKKAQQERHIRLSKLQDLGENYYHGKNGYAQDYAKAHEYFTQVEQAQAFDFDKEATLYYLGATYFEGLKDYKRAKSYFEKVVNSRLSQACKDYVNNCLAKIAQDQTAHDHAKRNQDLGIDYFYGTGSGIPNYTKAREHFELVEQAQVPHFDKTATWYYLGRMYIEARGIAADDTRAKSYFRNIVNFKSLDKADQEIVFDYLEQIALEEAEYEKATQNQYLGFNHYFGINNYPKNYTKAREHFELVEQAQVPRFDKSLTWYHLGGIYFQGLDVSQDNKRAKSYFDKVVNSSVIDQAGKDYVNNCLAKIAQDQQAHDQAKRNQDLGIDYYFGTNNCPQNYTRAREHFELVEQAQVPHFDKSLTWYHLGGIYYGGLGGVSQDNKLAKSYFARVVNSSTLDQAGKDYVNNCLAQIRAAGA